MDNEARTHLVNAYIERYAKRYTWGNDGVLGENDLNFWAYEEFDRLAHHDSETCWSLILDVIENTSDEFTLANLAAGPLEDFINLHGAAFIDRIERKAQSSQAFRNLLCGVWESTSPEIGHRLDIARSQSNDGAGA
jgi:uncharacterized protein DUF6869